MTDLLGIAGFPAAVPITDPVNEATIAASDPALAYVGSFAATVLQADCGAAWEAFGIKQDILGGNADRVGTSAARRVFYEDPRLGYFNADDLPGLFVYRAEKQAAERRGADIYRRKWPIGIAWLPPRTDAHDSHRLRNAFRNAVSASLYRAFIHCRHKAWVLDSDLEDDDGLIVAPQATQTSPATLTSFDGALAAGMTPGRPFQIKTSAATGAYNTADPILVTGLLDDGQSFTDSLYLTAANGGETVIGTWSYRTPTSVVIPAQLLTTGAFTFGFYRSPDVKLGSLMQRAAGFTKVQHKSGEWKSFTVAPPASMPGEPPTIFRGYELILDISEELGIDLSDHAELYDPTVDTALTAYFNQGNNNPFNSFEL